MDVSSTLWMLMAWCFSTSHQQLQCWIRPHTSPALYELIKSPQSGWLYVFSSFLPPRPRPPPPPPPQLLLLLTSKPFELHLRYLGQRKYRSGKMYWMTFWWPWPKVTAVTLMNTNLLACRIKLEPLTQSLPNLVAISLWLCWLDFGVFLLEICFFKFSLKIYDVLNTLLDISEEWLVRLMLNEKEVYRLDTGWIMWPWPLTSPMTLTL